VCSEIRAILKVNACSPACRKRSPLLWIPLYRSMFESRPLHLFGCWSMTAEFWTENEGCWYVGVTASHDYWCLSCCLLWYLIISAASFSSLLFFARLSLTFRAQTDPWTPSRWLTSRLLFALAGTLKRVCETEIGLVTQCCLAKHVQANKPQYLANLALKINVKVRPETMG
jgi:hypothetical protein